MSEAPLDEPDEVAYGWGDESDEEESFSPSAVADAVVTDTDWTTETILSQLRRGNIELNPRFQRRDAWDKTRKSRFIESLILGFPIPQLVLAENRTRRGTFIVLDGKQRLLTLRQFAEGSTLSASVEDDFRALVLSGLDIRQDLHGYDLAMLENDAGRIDDLNSFLNQTIRTVVVRRWPDANFLNTIFLRLNTGSVALSPQELRQALNPGEFSDFIDDFSAESKEIQRALRNKSPDFRMRDVELLLRYFAFRLFLLEYRGNLKAFLDQAVIELNGAWKSRRNEIVDIAHEFEDSIETTFRVFGNNAFFRWEPKRGRFERRFNRAIFDAIMYHFISPQTRRTAVDHAEQVASAFRNLCEDPEFLRSIQVTTKSISATEYRINAWGRALSRAIHADSPDAVEIATDSRSGDRRR